MPNRENSPAYAALPRSARRVFAAIERAIGDGSSASVSYTDFRLDHHIGRQSISVSLKLLDHLGLIEVEPGPREPVTTSSGSKHKNGRPLALHEKRAA